MDDFEKELNAALRSDPIDERGYYTEAFASLKGDGSGLRIASWIATIFFSFVGIYFLYMMLTAGSVDLTIKYGVGAVIFLQGQIAMKLWFNMQLNRRAITREIRQLGLTLQRR